MDESGQNPEILPPIVIEKPTSVTVFGILNIIFGGLGLLCTPFSIFGAMVSSQTLGMTAGYKMFLLFSNVAGFGFSIWLLSLGIGLLMFKGWARRGSVIYGWIIIVWNIIGTGLNVLALSLGWISPAKEQLPGFIGGMCGGVCGGMIYPVLLLVFMQTTKVKEAFGVRQAEDAASLLRPGSV